MQLDIQYDHFVRTTEGKHAALVKDVLQRVWDKVWYCSIYMLQQGVWDCSRLQLGRACSCCCQPSYWCAGTVRSAITSGIPVTPARSRNSM